MFEHDGIINAGLSAVVRIKSFEGVFDVKPRAMDALAFRVTGDAEFECRGERIFSHPGDIFFMPKNTPYTARYTDGEIIVFHFVSDDTDNRPKNFSGAFPEEIYRHFVSSELAWKEKNPGYKYYCTSALYGILGGLCREKQQIKLPDGFLGVVSEINRGFSSSDLCISELCRKYNISETYFRRLFKHCYGSTPVEYLTKLRLEYAENLLFSFYTVEEASNASGFADPKYFSRVVKKKLGLTPSELREKGVKG